MTASNVVVIVLSMLFLLKGATGSQSDPTFTAVDAEKRYAGVMNPTLQMSHLADLPGFTRSAVERDHSLLSVESRVFQPLPSWVGASAAHLISPAIGPSTHFSMALVRMAGGGRAAPPSSGVERLVFILSGNLTLQLHDPSDTATYTLQADSFAYVPPNKPHSLVAALPSSLLLIERRYLPLPTPSPLPSSLSTPSAAGCSHLGGIEGEVRDGTCISGGSKGSSQGWDADGPSFVAGRVGDLPVVPVEGENFVLRKLLPTDLPFDFNVHIMDFEPGQHLNKREVHYNQHGLLLLEGRGIYRLGDKWYPVQAGDVIWMAPFVPQWYAALGSSRSRYLIYKDTNRDPLLLGV